MSRSPLRARVRVSRVSRNGGPVARASGRALLSRLLRLLLLSAASVIGPLPSRLLSNEQGHASVRGRRDRHMMRTKEAPAQISTSGSKRLRQMRARQPSSLPGTSAADTAVGRLRRRSDGDQFVAGCSLAAQRKGI
jgi:hypothetical protein